jgi:hypothetical protein
MKKAKIYTIKYTFFPSAEGNNYNDTHYRGEGEVSYNIYNDEDKLVYSEDIISEWENKKDIEMTGLEIAHANGFLEAIIMAK